ncbi:MAG: hypothetical protein EXQ87_08855 [Alphaproteobacteria bacterium]|nr:hypothetical protein [Alphaproteobacteria bacterium]
MAQVIIRDIDDAVIARLKRKAELNGRSLEQQLRPILTAADPLSPVIDASVAALDRFQVP